MDLLEGDRHTSRPVRKTLTPERELRLPALLQLRQLRRLQVGQKDTNSRKGIATLVDVHSSSNAWQRQKDTNSRKGIATSDVVCPHNLINYQSVGQKDTNSRKGIATVRGLKAPILEE